MVDQQQQQQQHIIMHMHAPGAATLIFLAIFNRTKETLAKLSV